MIHRLWIGPKSDHHEWTRHVIESVHGESPKDWTLAELLQRFPDAGLHPDLHPRHNANIARYHLLWWYGGLWMDHDVIPLAPLTLPEPYTAAVGGVRTGCVLNFPMQAHPMLEEIVRLIRDDPALPIPDRSGQTLIDVVGRRHPEVRMEPRVIPFDRNGKIQPLDGTPLAVHGWSSSFPASRDPLYRRR